MKVRKVRIAFVDPCLRVGPPHSVDVETLEP